jgi:hypothetical protein
MSEFEDAPTGRSPASTLVSATVAAMGGMLFGFDTAAISGGPRSLKAVFGFSPSPLGLTVSSVLVGIHAKGSELANLTHWLMNALVSGLFPLLAEASSVKPSMLLFAITVIQSFLVLSFYSETKGISLEGMQSELAIESRL